MFNFIKKLRGQGFVCGFGFKPNSKPPTLIKSKEQLDKFCTKEIKKLTPAPEPEVRTPEIGCVVKSILEDLNLENYAKWEIFSFGIKDNYQKVGSKLGRKYRLLATPRWISHGICYGQRDYEITLKGFSKIDFTEDEKNALNKAFVSLMDFISETERKEKKVREQKRLEKLFPDCFKNTEYPDVPF